MLETIKRDLSAKVTVFFFLIYTVWFLYFSLTIGKNEWHYNAFTVTYGLIAAWGCIWGLLIAKKWGWIHSIMGKAILFFAIGLGLQELGQLGYTYYIYFLHIEVPYPSWGDVAFYGSIPCYILGIYYLSIASGIHISLSSFKNKLQAILIPFVLLIISYLVFLQNYQFDWSNPLIIIIDFGAPLLQSIYISLAILTFTLTKGTLGGMMKSKVLFILLALLAQFIADWTFLYQASRETWNVGGVNDYMFLISYTLMTLGLLQLRTTWSKLQQK